MNKHVADFSGYEFEPKLRRAHSRSRALAVPLPPTQASTHSVIPLLLGAMLMSTVPVVWLAPTQLILPSIALAALGLAAAVAFLAWVLRIDQSPGINMWDFAGILTLIGCGAGMVGDPEAVAQLLVGRES